MKHQPQSSASSCLLSKDAICDKKDAICDKDLMEKCACSSNRSSSQSYSLHPCLPSDQAANEVDIAQENTSESFHNTEDLIHLFGHTFQKSYQTRLVGGADEPEYRPKCDDFAFHRVIFTHDYFASALHEIAHWCIAGEQRRLLNDYGYWYAPDGRSADKQQAFEKVEVKPQAMEWMLSKAASWRFRLSADNLDGGMGPSDAFKLAVLDQVHWYCENGLPQRAQTFANCLAQWDFDGRRRLASKSRRQFQEKRQYKLSNL